MTFILYEKTHDKFRKLFVLYARNYDFSYEDDEDE
jgi:hypothetical protein